jgi:arylsulfatase A-like enzyme
MRRFRPFAGWRARAAAAALPVLFGACTRPAPSLSIRLVDLYRPELVEGRTTGDVLKRARTEWRFDGPPPGEPGKLPSTRGWEAGPGTADLILREGRLVGRATDDLPILHLARTSGLEDKDLLHEIEIRLRVSAGNELAFTYRDTEKIDLGEVAKRARELPWRLTSPIIPGGEARTYVLDARRLPAPPSSTNIRHLLLRPTNAQGARFEIESVRLVFRREHLASVPSGVGWQGLSGIYRETLVARSPETIRVNLRLSTRPRLELALGTVDDGPVTFRVGLRRRHREREDTLLERTLTTPQRWEEASLDLSPFAGEEVSLSLSLAAEAKGVLGLWGAPTVRSLGTRPPEVTGRKLGSPPPQGVILIWADTLRRDHLGVYGYGRPTSPVLDGLAAEGTLFRDCVGQATWTKVATPSLMTSLYPTSHGVKEFSDRLPNAARTIAEVYREAGYATLSFSSIIFTGRFTNLHKGFEVVHEDSSLPDKESSKTAREYVDRLLPWLEAHRDVPFFVFLHVSDPHDPYRPYPPYDSLWADPGWRGEHERQAKEVRKFISDPLLKLFGMPTWAELETAKVDPRVWAARDRDWYDGSIRGMDAEIGRLRQRLQTLGLAEKTLLVFTGDHGEEFLEHGRTFHGQTAYGELTGVPLILWGPGVVPSGRVVGETVRTIDIMPTLLDISRLPIPAPAQGESLLPFFNLKGTAGGGGRRADGGLLAARGRPAVSEKASTIDAGGPPPRDTESFALVSDGWKLIHNTKRHPGDAEFELYRHDQDPLDQTDLSAERPELVVRLARDLRAWQSRAARARVKPDEASAQTMSKEDLERLRSLGYIQ